MHWNFVVDVNTIEAILSGMLAGVLVSGLTTALFALLLAEIGHIGNDVPFIGATRGFRRIYADIAKWVLPLGGLIGGIVGGIGFPLGFAAIASLGGLFIWAVIASIADN